MRMARAALVGGCVTRHGDRRHLAKRKERKTQLTVARGEVVIRGDHVAGQPAPGATIAAMVAVMVLPSPVAISAI